MFQRWVIVPSFTEDGIEYRVTEIARGGGFVCECPAYEHSRVTPKTCKHITVVETARALVAACWKEHGGIQHGTICYSCLVRLLSVAAGKVQKQRKKTTRSTHAFEPVNPGSITCGICGTDENSREHPRRRP